MRTSWQGRITAGPTPATAFRQDVCCRDARDRRRSDSAMRSRVDLASSLAITGNVTLPRVQRFSAPLPWIDWFHTVRWLVPGTWLGPMVTLSFCFVNRALCGVHIAQGTEGTPLADGSTAEVWRRFRGGTGGKRLMACVLIGTWSTLVGHSRPRSRPVLPSGWSRGGESCGRESRRA